MPRLLAPLNRLWDALSPLKEAWRDLMSVLEAGAPYLGWCLGCALGIAFVSLAGFAYFAPFDDPRVSGTLVVRPITPL